MDSAIRSWQRWWWGLMLVAIVVLALGACRPAQSESDLLVAYQATDTAVPPTATAITTPPQTATISPSPTATTSPTASPTALPTSTATITAMPTAPATATPLPTETATATAMPSPTSVPPTATSTTAPATAIPTTQAAAAVQAQAAPAAQASYVPRLVLANYFAWFNADGWDDCNISAGDRPLQPYNSDDPAAIRRHVEMALSAGIDGFTLNWFAPGDHTDRNFAMLLAQSEGTNFRSTVVFSRHIWHGGAATEADIVAAIRHILEQYAGHPNFLRVDGRPVLFFTDVYRVPHAADRSPHTVWAGIREQVDPNREQWWIAEGLDPSYLQIMDGLYVHKITHASAPNAYTRATQWADDVRAWSQRTNQAKVWVATLSPGWDDRNAGCRQDVRVPTMAHQRARDDGAFYRATFDAAIQSAPDWLWINSFNEWVEGTHIEPSVRYGDVYLGLTRELVQQVK